MNFKKRVNGSWTNIPHYIHKTDTDTITALPAVIYADGNNATVGLVGNMSQTGTPTPDNPIMPQGCGNKTANLFDKSKRTDNSRVVYTTGEIGALFGVFVSDFTPIEPNTTYTLNIISSISGKTGHFFALYDENKNFVNTGAHEALSATVVYTFTTPSNVAYIRFNGNVSSVDEIMLNLGSTPLPYEPYGIKIPISSANTTTPIYLGEVQSTRKVKKLEFDGTENWVHRSGNPPNAFFLGINTINVVNHLAISTHYINQDSGSFDDLQDGHILVRLASSGDKTYIGLRDSNYPATPKGRDQLKEWLAQQYANGTPVTVWYVLANEETGTVNEPLRKIGDYADTVSGITIPTIAGANSFDVLTTLKPSEVTVNYKGWHPVADVHERENGAWT